MAHEAPHPVQPKQLSLPPLVGSPGDVSRLLGEIDSINEIFLQLSLRSGGTAVKVPKTSRLMDLTIQHNKLNLLIEADRTALKQYMEAMHQRAPRLHFSFSADPSAAFMEKLMDWLRHEIHPQVLVTVGLQPNIGAGCMVRSPNKYFDFSLSQTFKQKRGLLLQKLDYEPQTAAPSQ